MPRRWAWAAVAGASALGAWAHYEETGESCSFTLRPGTAPEPWTEEEAEALLERAFAFVEEFRPLPDAEAERINAAVLAAANASYCKPSTYLSLPVDEVLRHPVFGLRARRGAVVHDLGAGLGKPTARAVLVHGASAGVGVELSATRWRAGCDALRQLDRRLLSPERRPRGLSPSRVELRLGDVSLADVSGATHVLLFATCFPKELLQGLQRKLLQELPLGARVFCVGSRGLWPPRLEAEASAGAGGRRAMVRGDPSDDILQMVWTVQEAAGPGGGASGEL